jgi:CBS domain-containing protein
MKVHDIMSEPARTCGPETTLAQAARLMRQNDCGVLPVTDSDGCVQGILTDRDISFALANSNRSPRAIGSHEVMTRRLVFVRPDDDVRAALAAMAHGHVRRVLVIDPASGRLRGLVSLDDLAVRGVDGGIDPLGIVGVLRAICERRLALRAEAA